MLLDQDGFCHASLGLNPNYLVITYNDLRTNLNLILNSREMISTVE
jgi:hypothetical protein